LLKSNISSFLSSIRVSQWEAHPDQQRRSFSLLCKYPSESAHKGFPLPPAHELFPPHFPLGMPNAEVRKPLDDLFVWAGSSQQISPTQCVHPHEDPASSHHALVCSSPE